MQDNPPAALLTAEAMKALDSGLASGFPQKVAANALAIAQRESELGPALASAEQERLVTLLGTQGDLATLNGALANGLCSGAIDLGDELIAHLIRTTVAKLMIDQPSYPGFQALR